MELCKGEGVETGSDPVLASVLSLDLGAQRPCEPRGAAPAAPPVCSTCPGPGPPVVQGLIQLSPALTQATVLLWLTLTAL